MVIVTHDSAVAARGQRVGLLRDGRITVAESSKLVTEDEHAGLT